MRLFIIRHGKAQRDSVSGADFDRKLRPRGHRQSAWLAETIAADLARTGAETVRLLTSPVVRAKQTSAPIAEALHVEAVEESLLETGQGADDVMEVIDRETSADALLLVGHDPHFSEAVYILAERCGAHFHGLRTGECAVFQSDAGDPFVLVDFLRSDD